MNYFLKPNDLNFNYQSMVFGGEPLLTRTGTIKSTTVKIKVVFSCYFSAAQNML